MVGTGFRITCIPLQGIFAPNYPVIYLGTSLGPERGISARLVLFNFALLRCNRSILDNLVVERGRSATFGRLANTRVWAGQGLCGEGSKVELNPRPVKPPAQ